jgi:hypothetical protein
MESKDSHLIQIKLPDHSLLILTEEEFERVLRRGKSVIHNRLLKRRNLDSNIIEGEVESESVCK